MAQKQGKIIMKEIEKIIDSNKLKASNLRNCLLSINQNIYTNELHFQIIQFLGEFEYDLKTLFELFNEFKSKVELNFQKNINLIKNNKNKKSEENKSAQKSHKQRNLKNNTNIKNIFNKSNNKSTSSYLHLKNSNLNEKLKEILKSKIEISRNNLNKTNDFVYNDYIKQNNLNHTQIQKTSEKDERDLHSQPFQRRQISNSQINFYLNKSSTSNNLNRQKFFYDYDIYLTNLNKKNLYNSNINLIKYDNYIQNKNNNFNMTDIKEIARRKTPLDKQKKQKIIMDIFQDERLLNELKKQFGNDLENKLLNEDIDLKFFEKVEEIADKIRKKIYYTPKNSNSNFIGIRENIRSNFKIPKRFSNQKNENSSPNLANFINWY